jgi:hypothetical protein
VNELVEGLLGLSCCEKLVAEARDNYGEPRGRGTSTTGSHYQATTMKTVDENTSLCVTVKCKL